MFKIHLIGLVEDRACDSKTTRQQIEEMKKYELNLYSTEGEKIPWDIFDDPNEPRTILQAIEGDRKVRVDEKNFMADRPLFAVFTTYGNQIIRLEFYEGHDVLEKVYDIRSKELYGKDMPDYLGVDECAYDPAKFLEEIFGIPEEFSKPILDEVHNIENNKED